MWRPDLPGLHAPGAGRLPVPRLRPREPPGDPPARAERDGSAGTRAHADQHHPADPGGDVRARGRPERRRLAVRRPERQRPRQARRERRLRVHPVGGPDRDRRRRAVAAVHGDLPAREPDPHRDERVRPVGVRQHRRAGAREGPVPRDLLRGWAVRIRRELHLRFGNDPGRRGVGSDLRRLRCVRGLCVAAPRALVLRGTAPHRLHAHPDQRPHWRRDCQASSTGERTWVGSSAA